MSGLQVVPTVSPFSTGMDMTGRSLEDGFPKIDPEFKPFGSRVVVQLRKVMSRTRGGIILSADTKDTEAWNEQVGMLVAVGPLAFKNRATQADWPEGIWAKPGDFVKVPRYGGERWSVPGPDGEPVAVLVINDADLIGLHTGDPMKVKAYIA